MKCGLHTFSDGHVQAIVKSFPTLLWFDRSDCDQRTPLWMAERNFFRMSSFTIFNKKERVWLTNTLVIIKWNPLFWDLPSLWTGIRARAYVAEEVQNGAAYWRGAHSLACFFLRTVWKIKTRSASKLARIKLANKMIANWANICDLEGIEWPMQWVGRCEFGRIRES